MIQNTPTVNLGQSTFQDTFFVAGAQLTPFRKLRQLELEIKSIKDSLKKADINMRRQLLKLDNLNAAIPEEALDIEEIQYDIEGQIQLVNDANLRLANFELMKEQLLNEVPPEYWAQGYEQAETQYWVEYFSKQLAISQMCGLPPPTNTLEQMMLLPVDMCRQIAFKAQETTKLYISDQSPG